MWELNSIVRYLAGKHAARWSRGPKAAPRRSVDGLAISVMAPAITPVFWGLIRTPPEKRDPKAIDDWQEKTIAAVKMMDAQLGRTKIMAGDEFSYGEFRSAS